jgi:lantibiotic transport system permease protein
MTRSFLHSFQSEWLKSRRSLTSWLVIIGGFFLPVIFLIGRIVYSEKTAAESASPEFWQNLSSQCWQLMAIFLLPMGIILATSLITQIEFRNNTWKQVHTTPQSYSVIFWGKLTVIIVMLLQFFILFNIGIFLAGAIPALLFSSVDYPPQPFPFRYFLENNLRFFTASLPIVGMQYLISLQFRNFFVPLGAGIGLLLASLTVLEWEYGYLLPYSYSPYNFFILRGADMKALAGTDLEWYALGYFALFIVVSFVLYIAKKDKG